MLKSLLSWAQRSRIKAAQAELQRITDERANSIEIRLYRARRSAAKAGWSKRKGLA